MARYLTDHAARRARERHGWNRWRACMELGQVAAVGILVPVRHWHRVLASVVVISGAAVVTTWRLTLEQLADVLVSVALGVWP